MSAYALRPFAAIALTSLLAAIGTSCATGSSLPAPATLPAQPAPATVSPAAAGAPANPADVASIDAILTTLYDVISGSATQQRDWPRLRSLFLPGARLIIGAPSGTGEVPARSMTVEQWIESAEPFFREQGFWEREVARRVERYGNVAHAFSTYESRSRTADSPPFSRGINSIQLLTDGRRWWVVNILWDFERPGNPLPEDYLRSRTP